MKRYLSYILLFVSVGILNGMDQDREDNRFSVCYQIKQIDPNASRAAYRKLAETLSQNNLSACACMTYLMQKREKKAIGLITKNFVSEETENVVRELYKQQQQKDDASAKNGIPLTIHCSPSIDPDMQANIAEKFSGKYRTTIVPTEEFCPSGTDVYVARAIVLDYKKRTDDSDSGKLIKFTAENPRMVIGDDWSKKYSSNARNAVLEHERCHLEENHAVLRILWAFSLRNNSRYHHRRAANDEKEEIILSKLDRAHEAVADRIPAACNDCKLASDFVEWHDSAKMHNYLSKNDTLSHPVDKSFRAHPSDEKRLQWAQRIYNLKLAEQELKKNFEISKDMDEGHRSSTIFWLF